MHNTRTVLVESLFVSEGVLNVRGVPSRGAVLTFELLTLSLLFTQQNCSENCEYCVFSRTCQTFHRERLRHHSAGSTQLILHLFVSCLFHSSRPSSTPEVHLSREAFHTIVLRMENSEVLIKGSCACGRIQYTGTAMPDGMSNCHCHTCRKLGGGPFLAFASVPTASIHWLRRPDLWTKSDIAERGFCSSCGSTLSMQYYCQSDRIAVTASSIDDSRLPLRKASEHIFLKEKATWLDLPDDDGADRFEGMPPEFEVILNRWLKERSAAR